jgi:mannose-6-phosphate isomerase-like protein (cupin superfamily)
LRFEPVRLHSVVGAGSEDGTMKHDRLNFRPGFRLSTNAKSQGAVMVLPVGGKERGPDNFHRNADQWLVVLEGTGVALINGNKIELTAGTMLLIEAGNRHEIRNTGRRLLKTVSVYVPPAYRETRTPSCPPADN